MFFDLPPNCQIPGLENLYRKYFDIENFSDKLFVEVGAFDGYNFSNTYPLSKLGWKGIYIEPVQEFSNICKNNHSFNEKINVITCAIGEEEGQTEISIAGTLSTVSKENFDAYKKIDWASYHISLTYTGTSIVQVKRLETVLRENNIKNIDVLVVDVEGSEESVFKSFSFNEFLPRMIICEIEDTHKDLSKFSSIKEKNERVRHHILTNGYREVYRDQINTVFICD